MYWQGFKKIYVSPPSNYQRRLHQQNFEVNVVVLCGTSQYHRKWQWCSRWSYCVTSQWLNGIKVPTKRLWEQLHPWFDVFPDETGCCWVRALTQVGVWIWAFEPKIEDLKTDRNKALNDVREKWGYIEIMLIFYWMEFCPRVQDGSVTKPCHFAGKEKNGIWI